MKLLSLVTAVPSFYHTQKEWGDALQYALDRTGGDRRMKLLMASCAASNQIHGRYIATDDLNKIPLMTPQELADYNTTESVALVVKVVKEALQKAGVQASAVDALIISTSSGFLSPGLTSHVALELGIKEGAFFLDVIGMGCPAALATWRVADSLVSTRYQNVVCASVEICSSLFGISKEPGRMVLNSLFGDSASAVVWGPGSGGITCGGFSSVTLPDKLGEVQVVSDSGRLVPFVAPGLKDSVRELVQNYVGQGAEVQKVISHSGGVEVIKCIKELFPNLSDAASDVLRTHGNLSSNAVVFALEKELNASFPVGDKWLVMSFGSGLNITTCSVTNEG